MKKTVSKLLSAVIICTMIFSGCGDSGPEPQPASIGVLDKSSRTYENEYGNFGCKIPEEFEIIGLEDTGESVSSVESRLNDTELKGISENLDTITDLQAQSDNGDNYAIALQELSDAEWQMTADEFIDSILENRDAYVSSYESGGAEVLSVVKGKRQFLNESVPTVETTAEMYGITMNVSQLFVEDRDGKYVIVITLASVDNYRIDKMLSDFYEL